MIEENGKSLLLIELCVFAPFLLWRVCACVSGLQLGTARRVLDFLGERPIRFTEAWLLFCKVSATHHTFINFTRTSF